MKKLLSLILTIAMISTILVSTTLTVGAASQTVLDYGFASGESIPSGVSLYNVTSIYEDVGGRSDGVGFMEYTSGGNNRIDASAFNKTNNVSGLWIFETDLYLPASSFTSESNIQILLDDNTTDSWATHYSLRISDSSQTANPSVWMSEIPTDEWFKVRFEFDYRTGNAKDYTLKVYSVIDEQEMLLSTLSLAENDWSTNGFYRFRLSFSHTSAYVDNIKYYQPAGYCAEAFEISDAKIHYEEDFSVNSYDITATSIKTEGSESDGTSTVSGGQLKLTHNTASTTESSTGTLQTVSIPEISDKTILKVQTLDALCSRNRLAQLSSLDKYVSGVQVAEVDLYVPSEQIDTGTSNIVFIHLAQNSTWSNVQLYLRGNEDTGTSGPYTKNFPRDEWFTVRFVINYNTCTYYTVLEDEDGNEQIVTENTSISDVTKNNGISHFWIDSGSAQKYFYIGAMRYYEQGCENIYEAFPAENISGNNHTSYKVKISQTNIKYNKGASSNTVRWFRPIDTSLPADAVAEASKFVATTRDVRQRGGITNVSIDLKLNKALTTDEVMQVYLETFDDTSSSKVQYGDSISICGDKIWYGSTDMPAAVSSYPLNAWFTLRATYNHDTHNYRYEMLKEDGTLVLIGSGVAGAEQISGLGSMGVCGMTLCYDRPAGGSTNSSDIYFDNIKLENIVLDKVEFDDTSYTATVSYQANADTAISSKLVLAQYNTTGELISIQTATPVYTESATEATATFTKADGATKTKLMFLDDLNTVIPFATSIEK